MSTFTPKYDRNAKLLFADTAAVRAYRGMDVYKIKVGEVAKIERIDLSDEELTYSVKSAEGTYGIWLSEKDLVPAPPVFSFEYDIDGDVSIYLDGVGVVGYLDARSETSSKEHVETALKNVEDAQRRYEGRVAALAWHLEQQAAKAAEPDPEVLALARLFTGTDNPGKDAIRRSQRAYDAGVRAPASDRPFEVGDRVRISDDAMFALDDQTRTETAGQGQVGRVTRAASSVENGNVIISGETSGMYYVQPEYLTLLPQTSPF